MGARVAVVLAFACLITVTTAGAVRAAAARQPQTVLSLNAVVKAFAKSGLPLINPEAGFMNTVSTLTLAHTGYPYTLGVSVYPSVAQAERSFKGDESSWRRAGYAVALARNVIIAVVPKGATLGHKAAKPFPMPAKVAASIARLG